jgi:two-component system, chemotaxis family, protein-glutamate methylesterase/glutaminase
MTPQGSDAPGRDIVVIGASTGGIEALQRLVGGLPPELPAAVFVVQHLSATSRGYLPQILARARPLPAAHAQDRDPIRLGRIVVAPPDVHVLLADGRFQVYHGPKEHGLRPAIDPLFRSAARVFGPRVVRVILSGLRDDGTAGLIAVKLAGGLAIGQDPAEAAVPDMPRSVLRYLEVDHCLPAAEIAPTLVRLAQAPAATEEIPMSPDREERTDDIIQEQIRAIERSAGTDRPALVSCPDCGGPIWGFQVDGLTQFQCRVGHRYTTESFLARQAEALEHTLWAAVRMLDERAMYARRFAAQARDHDDAAEVEHWTREVEAAQRKAEALRQLLA